ncbi:monovalent cation/H+ antiporter complex subunit F [Streptomyces sp. I05A-00742]|uniref:monovalent cation/H+ antiporter complex subunit F n=1 Tax=Streptomyces sp. I05A-00742 TaxID=2732853 RepID=UPI002898CCBA|nr:monovalent cation/H+ antiporter complex subunit F [Streptomyces sp. I05A-00742]
MNGWLVAAALLLAGGLGPCLWGVSCGGTGRRMAAQNTATLLLCLVFLLLAQGYGRPAYTDLALVAAVLGPAGTLVFVRLLDEPRREDEADRDPAGAHLFTPLVALATVATVVPLCVATGPGRAMVKLIVIGMLLLAGGAVTARAVRRG